jgi:hypothetical protein
MQNPRDIQQNDSEDEDENNNDLAGNASGNIPDDYYEELNGKTSDSGTDNDDADDTELEGPVTDFEGLDDDDDLMDDEDE